MAGKKKTNASGKATASAAVGGEPPAEASAITIALPGAAEEDPILIDEAVTEINNLTVAHGLEHARGVAEVIVRRFGGGDLNAFRAGAAKHVSWRALAARSNLLVAHSFLWSSVAVLHQLRSLPEQLGNALPVSHHRRLLAVRDDDARLALATRAVEQKLSVQDLEIEVAKVRKNEVQGKRRGRKPLPAFAKSIRALPRLMKGVEDSEATSTAIMALGTDEATELLAAVDAHVNAITVLRDAISARLGAARD